MFSKAYAPAKLALSLFMSVSEVSRSRLLSVLTLIQYIQILQTQIDRDAHVQSLGQTLQSIFSFLEGSHDLQEMVKNKTGFERQIQTLLLIMQQTVECGYFIQRITNPEFCE